jgi:hypothetical protein
LTELPISLELVLGLLRDRADCDGKQHTDRSRSIALQGRISAAESFGRKLGAVLPERRQDLRREVRVGEEIHHCAGRDFRHLLAELDKPIGLGE